MLTKNVYDIPYPETTPVDMDEVKNFFDETLLPFFAEKLGLVIRTDLAVMGPEYATNSYICFLAPSAESDPYLAIYNVNNSGEIGRYSYAITPVKKVENYFRPWTIQTGGIVNDLRTVTRSGSTILLQGRELTTYKGYLVMIDFHDGRKVACFRSVRISDGIFVYQGGTSSIYFGPIKMNGNIVNTCVVLAAGFNSAWLTDYEQCACSTEITNIPIIYRGVYTQNSGLIYSSDIGKEFLISLDFCIGEDAYLPNCFWYSDCVSLSNLSVGTVLTINNKKYVCISYPNAIYTKLLIPEEVN